jgi:hypothetical protein
MIDDLPTGPDVQPQDSTQQPLPEAVHDMVEFLRAGKDFHYELLKKILQADERNMFHVDLVVIAAMHRSMSLIDGFTLLVEQRNALSAVPLVRMQIDNVIRLYACWLVKEPSIVAEALLADKPLHKIKSRSGQPLTDKLLYEAAAEHYPWIPEVYRQTSGFVHLSGRHIFAPIKSVDREKRTFTASIGGGCDWTEEEMCESVNAFIEATKALLHLCDSWLQTKEQGRMTPAERARLFGIDLPEEYREGDATGG